MTQKPKKRSNHFWPFLKLFIYIIWIWYRWNETISLSNMEILDETFLDMRENISSLKFKIKLNSS